MKLLLNKVGKYSLFFIFHYKDHTVNNFLIFDRVLSLIFELFPLLELHLLL